MEQGGVSLPRSSPGRGARSRVLAHPSVTLALVLSFVSVGQVNQANEPPRDVPTRVATTRTSQQMVECHSDGPSAPGGQAYVCTFAAPARCTIVSATATPIGGVKGDSLAVTVAPDGTQVTSVVTARLGDQAANSRPFRPLVSITATLRCLE